MQALFDTLESIRKNPFKSAVTFLSVGIGVGILIFALSISQYFSEMLEEKINQGGIVLTVSNTELQSDGSYDRIRPGEFDLNAYSITRASVSGAKSSAVVVTGVFDSLVSEGDKFTLRSAVGVSEEYLDVMGLELLNGLPMTAEDVTKGLKKMWLSEDAAVILYGSADAAIGKQVQTPTSRGPGRREAGTTIPLYTIEGVYKNPDELKREAYGIGDMFVPYTSMISSSVNSERLIGFYSSTFVLKVDGNDSAEGQIRDVIANEYGYDANVNVWEGTTDGPSTLLSETRESVRQVTLIINVLGFILLVSGAIGILSIMLVEIIGKNRDIAIERALGASIPRIVRKFLTQALILSGLSALIGIALAYFFAAPLAQTVTSVFEGFSASDVRGSIITPVAVLIGFASALVFGGLFGILPLHSLVKRPIAEGIRDA
ncbi:ABC transporter permease [Reinekea marinisedimentorum]|uniref:ABC-type antimicrobial peptide transport system permease subunit n=1 Tax=Reinekea marinisedimentorum TaxID=230495 RepID=A0A4R3HRT4_9GAMM|nr:ABC transporter permease [Reinekea marinisedimentorum]TCS35692.1 ABC-type antimicrobial peptide transport system permease subunit [Reinekea marinisedimentorum]